MKKLLVFIGTIGCGKTTLLNHLNVPIIDVFDYVKKHFDHTGGLAREEDALLAYNEMFTDLARMDPKIIYLELGTN